MRRRIAFLAIALLCGGCSLSPLIDADIVSYNKAVLDASNKLLVLNILRARDREPLLFSSVQLVHGALVAGGTANLLAPFGNPPLHVNNSAGLSLTTSVAPTFDVSSLDTQDFTRGILQPIDPQVVKYFLDRGDLDPKIILLLFFSELEDAQGDIIKIDPDSAIGIQTALQVLTSGKVDATRFIANTYSELKPVGSEYELAPNSIKDVAGIDQSKFRVLPVGEGNGTRTYRLYAVSTSPKVAFCLKVLGADATNSRRPKFIALGNLFSAESAAESAEDPRCFKDEVVIEPGGRENGQRRGFEKVSTRSVEGIVQFLGAILRWEQVHVRAMTFDDFIRAPSASEPAPTLFGSNTSDVFFSLSSNGQGGAYDVEYKGQDYAASGGLTTDHSLEVLALLSKLLAMNKSAKDLPVTQSVQIVP